MARTIESAKTDSNGDPIISITWTDSERVTLAVNDGDDLQAPLLNNLANDTLIEIPGGNYTLGGMVDTDGFDRTGIVPVEGTGRIEIQPTEPNTSTEWASDGVVLSGSNVSNQAFVGIDWLCETDGYDGGSSFTVNGGDLLYKNIRHIGQQSENNFFSTSADTSSDNVVVEGCDASYGMPEGADPNAGILATTSHAGSLYIHNCIIQHYADGGVYVSNPWENAAGGSQGTIDITNSKFHNNNAYQNRFAGGTLIDNCEYKIADTLVPEWGHAAENGYTWGSYTSEIDGTKVMRLFRNDYQAYDSGHSVIQNIEVDATDSPRSTSSILALIDDDSPASIEVNDSNFALDSPYYKFYRANGDPAEFTNDNITLYDVGEAAIQITETGLTDLIFTNCCIDISNDSEALFDVDSNATISGGNLSLGTSTLNIGTGTVTSNPDTTGQTCNLPVLSGGGGPTANLFDNWSIAWDSTQSEWSVESDARFTKGARLTLDAPNRGRRALIFNDVGTNADCEISTIVRTPSTFGTSTSSGSHLRPIVRGGTSNGNETGYFVATGSNGWSLFSYNPDGTGTNFGSWGTPQTDTKYRMRLRADGSNIKAKTWENETTEPSTWDIEITDTTHTSGWCGVGSFEAYDEFGYVGAGINGQTAPLPEIIPSTPVKSNQGVVMSVSGIVATISERVEEPTYTLIDSFEDGGITEYTGDTASFNVVQNPTPAPFDGEYALRTDTANNSDEIISTSGLDNYFSKGQVVSFYHYVDSSTTTMAPYFLFGVGDASNYYEIAIDYGGSTIEWRKNDAGTFGFYEDSTLSSIAPQQWIEVRITWDDGTLGGADNDHTIEVFDQNDNLLGTHTTNDATHATNSGVGVGFRAKDSIVWYDFINRPA